MIRAARDRVRYFLGASGSAEEIAEELFKKQDIYQLRMSIMVSCCVSFCMEKQLDFIKPWAFDFLVKIVLPSKSALPQAYLVIRDLF